MGFIERALNLDARGEEVNGVEYFGFGFGGRFTRKERASTAGDTFLFVKPDAFAEGVYAEVNKIG